jgi:hypothetical protein
VNKPIWTALMPAICAVVRDEINAVDNPEI